VRPVASDNAADFVVNGVDDFESSLDLPPDDSSWTSGRVARLSRAFDEPKGDR
jgi:hypothetical protein